VDLLLHWNPLRAFRSIKESKTLTPNEKRRDLKPYPKGGKGINSYCRDLIFYSM
jgi:hypothetical protein